MAGSIEDSCVKILLPYKYSRLNYKTIRAGISFEDSNGIYSNNFEVYTGRKRTSAYLNKRPDDVPPDIWQDIVDKSNQLLE